MTRTQLALAVALAVVGTALLLLSVGNAKEIRIENASALDFTDLHFAGERFGDLAAGQTSAYRTIDLNFRYGALRFTADGRTLTGQTLSLGARRFRYRIDAVDLESGQLAIEVIRE